MKIGKKIKPREEVMNCPNCSAPISGDRCDYCGTQFIDCTTIRPDKPFYLKISPDGKNTFISKVRLESVERYLEPNHLGYTEEIMGIRRPLCWSPPVQTFTVTYVSVD